MDIKVATLKFNNTSEFDVNVKLIELNSTDTSREYEAVVQCDALIAKYPHFIAKAIEAKFREFGVLVRVGGTIEEVDDGYFQFIGSLNTAASYGCLREIAIEHNFVID